MKIKKHWAWNGPAIGLWYHSRSGLDLIPNAAFIRFQTWPWYYSKSDLTMLPIVALYDYTRGLSTTPNVAPRWLQLLPEYDSRFGLMGSVGPMGLVRTMGPISTMGPNQPSWDISRPYQRQIAIYGDWLWDNWFPGLWPKMKIGSWGQKTDFLNFRVDANWSSRFKYPDSGVKNIKYYLNTMKKIPKIILLIPCGNLDQKALFSIWFCISGVEKWNHYF